METDKVLAGEQWPLLWSLVPTLCVCVVEGGDGASASSPHETRGEIEAQGGKRTSTRPGLGRYQRLELPGERRPKVEGF